MLPELFTIPFINISVKSYGFMMVLAFFAAMSLVKYRCKKLGVDPEEMANISLAALFLGVIGARLFHVIHNWSALYADNFLDAFKVWNGGLEFLGGFIFSTIAFLAYAYFRKRPILNMLDIMAPALMIGLGIGRIGCLLNGCCFGAPCEVPWAITFPPVNEISQLGEAGVGYRYSPPYESQIYPTPDRSKTLVPLVQLPEAFTSGFSDGVVPLPVASPKMLPAGAPYFNVPKAAGELTESQRAELSTDFPMVPIHPTQLYSFVNGVIACLVLNFCFRIRKYRGQIFAWMLIYYGIARFVLESLRFDNPIEATGLTISQNLGIVAVILGVTLHIALRKRTI